MKKNFKKYLAVLLAVMTMLSTFALASCNSNIPGEDTDVEPAGVSHGLSMETQSSPFMKLSATTGTRATANGNVLVHTLTATVLPENAPDKAVYWAVNWEDTTRQEIVSSYVLLTPNENGGNIATVTCLRPFTGNVVITVTTKEGGLTASCICKYVGLPTTMRVDLSNVNTVKDTHWNTDIVEVGQTTTYHEINLSNVFGAVGTTFTPEYDLVLEPHGGIYAKNETYSANGDLIDTTRSEVPLQTTDFFDTQQYGIAYFMGNTFIHTIQVGLRDGQLYITGKNYPSAYGYNLMNNDNTVSKASFDGYIDGKEPYVTVTFIEKVTGLTYTFNVRTVGTVSDVILDHSEIIF